MYFNTNLVSTLSGRTLDWKRTQNETFIVPSQFLLALITLPANHLNSHGTSKGSLGYLELAFDRFRDVLHERLDIKHKLGMLFCNSGLNRWLLTGMVSYAYSRNL